MGDPKFPRRMYDTPSHPWNGDRIQEEKSLVRKYGLKNKREVWKAQTRLRTFRGTARGLLSKLHTPSPQIKKESSDLLRRMSRLGLLSEGATLDDILALGVENLLGRRLQTVVYLKGLASTPKQARQFITHGHVTVDGRKVTVPSYLVKRGEEDAIDFEDRSAVADPRHPVRARPEEFATGSATTTRRDHAAAAEEANEAASGAAPAASPEAPAAPAAPAAEAGAEKPAEGTEGGASE